MKYVKTKKWFAWHPIKTEDNQWIWLKEVWRTTDERPEHYQGLLPIVTYNLTRKREEITPDIFRQMTLEEHMELLYLRSVGLQPDGEGGWVAMMGFKSYQRLTAYEHALIDKYTKYDI